MNASFARLTWLLMLVALTPAILCAQVMDEAGARTKILALEHAWNQAEAFGDLKALDSILDNALVYVDADGALMTKAQFLSHVKSSHLQQVVTQSMTVQIFESAAVVTGTYEAKSFQDGRPR